ncbi:phosphopantetheine-binding protein [Kitasatospora sp. NPDC056138]|uniref:phosphopantetheine-binding protein n=1 Tax=Kitasatospora sp. NPDC056138 TaxID=3345724 RepID=UPI0035E142C5
MENQRREVVSARLCPIYFALTRSLQPTGEEWSSPIQSDFISEEAIRGAVRRTLTAASRAEVDFNIDTRLDDLDLDSLLIAEVIVELEEELDVLLDLHISESLLTLGDLARALRPVRSSE